MCKGSDFSIVSSPSDLYATSLTYLLSPAPSDLSLGKVSRMHNESDFSLVSGSQ